MSDVQREILNQVAAGTMTAEEGAARLEALEAGPAPSTASIAEAPRPAASQAVAQVKVVSRFATTEIIGDPSVASAVADGPHRARQDGDTLVIEQSPVNEDTTFEFSRPHGRVVVNGFDFARKLTIRMNPALALTVNSQAGNLRIQGVNSPVVADVQAGNCKVSDFRGPVRLSVIAGNIEANGLIDTGQSSIRCEMGQVKVNLSRSSSVRITARTTMGKVAIEGEGIKNGRHEVAVGSGTGTLDLECTMGNVKVTVG